MDYRVVVAEEWIMRNDEPMRCPLCGQESPFKQSVAYAVTFKCRNCGQTIEGKTYAEAVYNWNKPYYGGK